MIKLWKKGTTLDVIYVLLYFFKKNANFQQNKRNASFSFSRERVPKRLRARVRRDVR
jgi:hypothetical protein